MNSTPSASPASNTGMMCGSSTAAAARDSRMNRCRNAWSAANDAPMSRQGIRVTFSGLISRVLMDDVWSICWVADKTGRVHSGEGKLLLGHAQQGRNPGTADESLAGQHGCGSRFAGQAVPGELALAGGAEVAVDLAGDVTLQAADDLFLRQAFLGAPLDVGQSRRVGAHPGEHDPP